MEKYKYIVILVGVCGTGKRAVGEKVAQRLDVPFFDADKPTFSEDLPEGSLPQEVNMEKWLNAIKNLILTIN